MKYKRYYLAEKAKKLMLEDKLKIEKEKTGLLESYIDKLKIQIASLEYDKKEKWLK